MTNEEKAQELGIKYQTPCHGIGDCEFEAKQAAMEMAEWKDSQLKHYLETFLEKAQKRAMDKLVITLESMIEELGL